jgi:hypothetical protein
VQLEALGVESTKNLTYKTGSNVLSCVVKKIEKPCYTQSCMLYCETVKCVKTFFIFN